MKLYMFRTVPLSIIRSFSLCIQQWYMLYGFTDNQSDALISNLFWNETLYVSESSSVHHQEFFTVPTAMVCHTGFLTACEQDQDGTGTISVLILLASCQQTCMAYTIAVCTVKNS